jgi:hypothetical protein
VSVHELDSQVGRIRVIPVRVIPSLGLPHSALDDVVGVATDSGANLILCHALLNLGLHPRCIDGGGTGHQASSEIEYPAHYDDHSHPSHLIRL